MVPAVEPVMDDRLCERRQMPVQAADKKNDESDEKEEEIKALTELTLLASSSSSPRYL